MSFRSVFLLGLFFLSSAQASEYVVTELLSDTTVRIRRTIESHPPGEREAVAVLFSPSATRDPLGYVELQSRIPTEGDHEDWVATVKSKGSAAIIRVGATARIVDLTTKIENLPARYDLIQMNRRQVSNRYKPQVYLGVYSGQTAATLYNSEKLIGPFLLAYGLMDRLQIDTSPAFASLGEPSIGLKWLGYEDDENRISMAGKLNYSLRGERSYGSVSFYWDSFSSSRFISFTQLNFLTRQPSQVVGNSDISDRRITAELQSFSGLLTGGWNRVVAGPKFNVEKKTIGGSIAYYQMGDRFDWMMGLRADNFVNGDFSAKGYLVTFDFWWRL